eukprot:GHUV01019031.1.p1 GENE.GHUV01019031.1~~GHUV01019031.1.p1  ORF type:complete len:251 (+),score=69.82 GHUV01019031.1:205-957(+)
MLHGHKPFNQLLHIGRGLLALCASVTQAIVLLLPQGAYPSSQWVPPAHLAGNRTADTATFYDTNSQQMLLQRPALTTSVLGANLTGFGIPRPAAAGFSGLTSSAASNSAPLLGNARKPRLNNSISLNKQIMNTHSMRELHNIVRSKGAGFDFFNISSAIARVPKLVGPTGGVQVGAIRGASKACSSWVAKWWIWPLKMYHSCIAKHQLMVSRPSRQTRCSGACIIGMSGDCLLACLGCLVTACLHDWDVW